MPHFLSRLCWPLLKVHFAGHAHVKLYIYIYIYIYRYRNVGHRLGMWVTGYELSTRSVADGKGILLHIDQCKAVIENPPTQYPLGINTVGSARTKIERWDVQIPISKYVVGIFYSRLESWAIAV